MPAIVPVILSLVFSVVGVWIWFLCLPTQWPPWREHHIRHYHGRRSHAHGRRQRAHGRRQHVAQSRPVSTRPAANGIIEAQALNALIANRGHWYCPSCWGAASGLAPTADDLTTLDQIARTRIAESEEYERMVTNGSRGAPASSVCVQHGQPYCVFDGDGARRTGWGKQDWLVRAKPLNANSSEP